MLLLKYWTWTWIKALAATATPRATSGACVGALLMMYLLYDSVTILLWQCDSSGTGSTTVVRVVHVVQFNKYTYIQSSVAWSGLFLYNILLSNYWCAIKVNLSFCTYGEANKKQFIIAEEIGINTQLAQKHIVSE